MKTIIFKLDGEYFSIKYGEKISIDKRLKDRVSHLMVFDKDMTKGEIEEKQSLLKAKDEGFDGINTFLKL